MPSLSRRSRPESNIWPGFVDALATLLMVIVFLVMIFVLAQFFLGEALSGRDAALQKLENQVSELADLLALERKGSEELRLDVAQLAGELQSSVAARGDLISTIEALTIRAEEGEAKTARLDRELEEAFATIMAGKDKIELQVRQIVKLDQQVTALQALKDDLQVFLGEALSGRDAALQKLENQVSELADLLALERKGSEELRLDVAQLAGELQSSVAARGDLISTIEALTIRAEEGEAKTARLDRELEEAFATIMAGKDKIELQVRQIVKLDQQVTALQALKDDLQVFLGEALSGRDAALQKLENQVSELADLLALERKGSEELRLDVAQLAGELQSSVAARGDLISTIEALTIRAEEGEAKTARLDRELEEAFATIMAGKDKIELQVRQIVKLDQQVTALQALKDDLQDEIANLSGKLGKTEASLTQSEAEREKTRTALGAERELSQSARANLALLNRQMAALREQLAKLSAVLDESETRAERQKVQISSLGRRLNAALASKVQELSRYRSEFFGRLREVLGRQPGIRIVGDRFVFQSEVLFATGSADIGGAGKEQLTHLASTLGEISPKIPQELNWILRIDGHTDRVPINTAKYPSNWELSTARAISVVRFLIASGIPAERLAATGFGENQPIDDRNDEIGRRRNRRIELKLTQR